MRPQMRLPSQLLERGLQKGPVLQPPPGDCPLETRLDVSPQLVSPFPEPFPHTLPTCSSIVGNLFSITLGLFTCSFYLDTSPYPHLAHLYSTSNLGSRVTFSKKFSLVSQAGFSSSSTLTVLCLSLA